MAVSLVYPEKENEEKKETKKPKAKNIRRMASVKRSKVEVMKEIQKDVEKTRSNSKTPVSDSSRWSGDLVDDCSAIVWGME